MNHSSNLNPSGFFLYTPEDLAHHYGVLRSEVREFIKNLSDWTEEDFLHCMRCSDAGLRSIGFSRFLKWVKGVEMNLFKFQNLSEADQDDIRQECYLDLFQIVNKPGWELGKGKNGKVRKASLKNYYGYIVRNKIIRFKKGLRQDMDIDELNEPVEDLPPNVEENWINREQLGEFREQFAKLSEKHRQVLELRYFKGYSYADICTYFDHTNEGTSRNLVSAALKKLRKIISLQHEKEREEACQFCQCRLA